MAVREKGDSNRAGPKAESWIANFDSVRSAEPRRIGVYFGAFDPPHEGHFLLARNALGVLGLHQVLMVPNLSAPNKESEALSHRVGMIGLHPLAQSGRVQPIQLSKRAVANWSGRGRICQMLGEDGKHEVVLLIGQDSFETTIANGSAQAVSRTLITPACPHALGWCSAPCMNMEHAGQICV